MNSNRYGILIVLFLMSLTTYAFDNESLVLMKSTEIQSLPTADRDRYLQAVRSILAKGPDEFLIDESSGCGIGRKACAVALFGDGQCIPKNAENEAVACEAEARKSPGFRNHQWLIEPGGDVLWSAYEQRLNSYCAGRDSTTGPSGSAICKALHEKRVQVFMSRRTH